MKTPISWVRIMAVSGVLPLGCTEFVQTNPFHPDFPMSLAIVGPDSVTSNGAELTYQALFDPPWPDAPLEWEVSGVEGAQRFFLGPAIDGKTLVHNLRGSPDLNRITVRVRDGTRTASKDIVGVLRVHHGEFACVLVKCGAYIGAPSGTSYAVNALKRDALGNQADEAILPSDIGESVVSRDTSIIKVERVVSFDHWIQTRITAHAPGSTFLVFTKYGSDSVRVYSTNRPTSITPGCPTALLVGQTTPLTYTLFDSNGESITAPHAVRWTLDAGFSVVYGLDAGMMRVDMTGTVTLRATVVSYAGMTDFGPSGTAGPSATCTVQVNR
jgi:hypothetical protein